MPGTPASRMRDQVPPEERKARSRRLIEALQEGARQFKAGNVGGRRPVLWESFEEQGDGSWRLGGLTDNYIRIHCRSRVRRWNEIDRVDLIGVARDGLEGIIVK
jgi:tRNA A37 methylthiotransferase MiaB